MESEQKPTAEPEEKVLVLRTCAANMVSRGNHPDFKWPTTGLVECPDWSPEPKCGHGLHGMLWGEGDGNMLSWATDAKWLVVLVLKSEMVELFTENTGKVKFPRGEVVFCGAREDATKYLAERAPGRAIIGGQIAAGDEGTATAGTRGTATAGDEGTATAGYEGTATAGTRGTATAGDAGIIVLRWYDGKRFRIATFYVGEDGIEPGVKYRCENGKAVKVD